MSTLNTGGYPAGIDHEPDDGSDSAIDDACLHIVNALLAARDESAAVGRVIVRSPEVETEVGEDIVWLTLPSVTLTVPRMGDATLMALYALEDLYCATKAALEHHKATT